MSIKTYLITIFTFLGTNITLLLGGYDKLLSVLVTFVVIDYITGLAKAAKNKQLNSYTGWKGIAKKVGTFIVIVAACKLDSILSDGAVLRTVAIMFYISNEGLSIVENLAELDVAIPKQIKERLSNLNKTLQDDDKEDEE